MQLALPSRDYYQKEHSEAELEAYHRYMTNIAILLGADSKTAFEEFKKVIALEKDLANVCNEKFILSMLIFFLLFRAISLIQLIFL